MACSRSKFALNLPGFPGKRRGKMIAILILMLCGACLFLGLYLLFRLPSLGLSSTNFPYGVVANKESLKKEG